MLNGIQTSWHLNIYNYNGRSRFTQWKVFKQVLNEAVKTDYRNAIKWKYKTAKKAML